MVGKSNIWMSIRFEDAIVQLYIKHRLFIRVSLIKINSPKSSWHLAMLIWLESSQVYKHLNAMFYHVHQKNFSGSMRDNCYPDATWNMQNPIYSNTHSPPYEDWLLPSIIQAYSEQLNAHLFSCRECHLRCHTGEDIDPRSYSWNECQRIE